MIKDILFHLFLIFISIFLIFLMEVELGHHHANTAQGQGISDSDNKENVYFKIWINLRDWFEQDARLLHVLDWGLEAPRSECWSVVGDTKSSLYNSWLHQLVESALKDRPVHCGPTNPQERGTVALWARIGRINKWNPGCLIWSLIWLLVSVDGLDVSQCGGDGRVLVQGVLSHRRRPVSTARPGSAPPHHTTPHYSRPIQIL